MFNVLRGMRVIEGASFIAAPSCALHLAQLGAEIIRFDMIGGGPDRNRWPVAPNGASLYWEGLNKGKKSIAIDLSRPEGRELACELITAPDPSGGLFVTNFPAEGFLAHEALKKRRGDLITLRVMGWANGDTALDYTVNAATGFPLMTGPVDGTVPVNHVLPAWDLLAGAYGAFALMAAERHRRETGQGQEIRVPLGDIAIAAIGNLGQIAEVSVNKVDRPRFGNDLFGALGRDFRCADGAYVMIVAITPRQWTDLVTALQIQDEVRQLETELGVSFARDETIRFQHRARLFALIEARIARLSVAELSAIFTGTGVCWDRYRSVKQAVTEDRRLIENPILASITQPSGHTYPAPGAAAEFTGLKRSPPVRAPQLGEHTDDILAAVLNLSGIDIARLHDKHIVAGPPKL
jgi:2-methylfumaryl-CoA isomerase